MRRSGFWILSLSLPAATLLGDSYTQNQDFFYQRNFDQNSLRGSNDYFVPLSYDNGESSSSNSSQDKNGESQHLIANNETLPTVSDLHDKRADETNPEETTQFVDNNPIANPYLPVADDYYTPRVFDAGYQRENQSSMSCCEREEECSPPSCEPVQPFCDAACGRCETCCDRSPQDWDIWIYPNYFYLGYTGGKGISYHRGYTTLGVFLAPSFLKQSCFQSFLDAKGYVFDNGKWASSFGVGTRYFVPSKNLVLGCNLYYDYRRVRHFNFNQVGIGLEVLSPCWDFRLNGYIPVGEAYRRERTLFDYGDGFFAIRNRRVSAWYGFDAELGSWIMRKYPCDWFGLYLAGGPYYYFREHRKQFDSGQRETWGGRVRLLARVCDMLDVSVMATYDHIWHTRVQGMITLTIPLDGSWFLNQKCDCRCSCPPCLLEQIAQQPVQRNGIIVTDDQCCWDWNWNSRGNLTSHSMSLSSFSSGYDMSDYSGSY